MVKGQGNESVLFRVSIRIAIEIQLELSPFARVSRARRTFELDRYIGIVISSVVACPR